MALIFNQEGLTDLTGNYSLSATGSTLNGEVVSLNNAPIVTTVPMNDYRGGSGVGPYSVLVKFGTNGLPSSEAYLWKGGDDVDPLLYIKLLNDGSLKLQINITTNIITGYGGNNTIDLLRTDGTLNSLLFSFDNLGAGSERRVYLNGVRVSDSINYGGLSSFSGGAEFGDPSHNFSIAQARIYTNTLTAQDAIDYENENVITQGPPTNVSSPNKNLSLLRINEAPLKQEITALGAFASNIWLDYFSDMTTAIKGLWGRSDRSLTIDGVFCENVVEDVNVQGEEIKINVCFSGENVNLVNGTIQLPFDGNRRTSVQESFIFQTEFDGNNEMALNAVHVSGDTIYLKDTSTTNKVIISGTLLREV